MSSPEGLRELQPPASPSTVGSLSPSRLECKKTKVVWFSFKRPSYSQEKHMDRLQGCSSKNVSLCVLATLAATKFAAFHEKWRGREEVGRGVRKVGRKNYGGRWMNSKKYTTFMFKMSSCPHYPYSQSPPPWKWYLGGQELLPPQVRNRGLVPPKPMCVPPTAPSQPISSPL